jgi:hypothetical protein
MEWGTRLGLGLLMVALGGGWGCQEFALSSDDREQLAEGDYTLLRVLRSNEDGSPWWVLALRDVQAGTGALELIAANGHDTGCEVGPAADVWLPSRGWPVDGPPFYRTLWVDPSARLGRFANVDAEGFGELSYFDFACAHHEPALGDAHRDMPLVDPDRLGATWARTRSGELWWVNPQIGAAELVADGVEDWQVTEDHLWTVEDGRLVRRPRDSTFPFPLVGNGVRDFSVREWCEWNATGCIEPPTGLLVAYEDAEGVHVHEPRGGSVPELVDPDACAPDVEAGVLLALSPCGPNASVLLHAPATGESLYFGETVTAAVTGWWRQRVVFYTTGADPEAPEELYLWSASQGSVRVAVGLTVPERFWEGRDHLYMADFTVGHWLGRWSEEDGFELLATGVHEVHHVHQGIFYTAFVLADFDGSVGQLYQLDLWYGALTRLARGVPLGGIRAPYPWQWIAYIDDYRGPDEGGTLRVHFLYSPEHTLRVDGGVTDFELSTTHATGLGSRVASLDLIYTVVAPARAGLWLGRYQWPD